MTTKTPETARAEAFVDAELDRFVRRAHTTILMRPHVKSSWNRLGSAGRRAHLIDVVSLAFAAGAPADEGIFDWLRASVPDLPNRDATRKPRRPESVRRDRQRRRAVAHD